MFRRLDRRSLLRVPDVARAASDFSCLIMSGPLSTAMLLGDNEDLREYFRDVHDAIGVGPRRRRRFAAVGMGLLATFSSVLAIPAGLIPAVLYMRSNRAPGPGGSIISIPSSAIVALTIGVPCILAAIGWLTAGRSHPLAALRT